jgi:hypothetical protein
MVDILKKTPYKVKVSFFYRFCHLTRSSSVDNNKDKKASDDFNKVAKGAAAGAGIAFAIGLTPLLPVTLPVLAVGAGIGAWVAHKKNK